MEYLCKPQPTQADLLKVREESRALRTIIEEFMEGKRTESEFFLAKQRVKDLALLVQKALERLQKSKFKIL